MTPEARKILDELGTKRPNPTMGVSPSWLWWGRQYLMVRKDIAERVKDSILPDFVFEALDGYATSSDITRGYDSKEEAYSALNDAIRNLKQ